MKEYKQTLNLPKTSFPMKANLAQREPERIEFWNNIDLYQKLREAGKSRSKYILHDGPPYANGQIHIGHAVNKILKDIIVKFKTLDGYDAPLVLGWDCHGLPIELNVEKKTAGKDLTPKQFRNICRKYAQSQVDLQSKAFHRLGVLADWPKPYLTMDFSYEANIVRSLAGMLGKGHLQQGYKPVHWCVDCGSALAEAEVEYKDKQSYAIDVAFTVVNPKLLKDCFRKEDALFESGDLFVLPIWTTTPWTLPANEAVAVGEKIEYGLFKTKSKQHFILPTELSVEILKRYGIDEAELLGTVNGTELCELKVKHPLLEKEVPVITAAHVTLDAGTGAVHTAPAHGVEDYEAGRQNNLPMEQLVDHKGCYISDAEILPGVSVFDANPEIVQLLKDKNRLLASEKLEHSYPHCWRHKTPLIFRATPQWFVRMDAQHLRKDTLQAIQDCQWIPHWGESRISNMIANRPDWCISRQRMWGTPLPMLIHKETNQPHPESEKLMLQVADRIEKEGIDAWFDLEIKDLIGKDAENYYKLNDTLDVWFDSGVSHTCVLKHHSDLAFPADVYFEGSDQHRGWFHSSILTSVALYKEAPYKTVLTHGYVVDSKGHKMSKSLGNVIDPLEVVKTLGADILRLWVASSDYKGEMSASKEIVGQAGEAYRRIRNTARFILSNLSDFDPSQKVELWNLDKKAIDQTAQLTKEIKAAYDEFQFHVVCQKIHYFCSEEMGGFYLDILKDRLYTMPANSVGRRSAQTALYALVNALTKWIAPILSFTAEEIWQCLREKDESRKESVFLETFSEAQNANTHSDWSLLKRIKNEVNKVLEHDRNEGKIGSSLNAEVTLYCDQEGEEALYRFLNEQCEQEKNDPNQGLRFILIVSDVHVKPVDKADPKGVVTEIPGLWVEVSASSEEKCQRCWHHRKDVGQYPEFPGVCGRCATNLGGE